MQSTRIEKLSLFTQLTGFASRSACNHANTLQHHISGGVHPKTLHYPKTSLIMSYYGGGGGGGYGGSSGGYGGSSGGYGGGGFGGGERRPPPARRDGDWECPACHANNFASRSECFKCRVAKCAC